MIYYGKSGKRYDLEDDPFASGGEGKLFNVIEKGILSSEEKVAKIFKSNVDIVEKEEKVMAMLKNMPDDPFNELTWPIEKLYDGSKRFVGYVMKKAESGESLNILYEYGPFSKFPGLSLSSKITVAANICSALNNVHGAGHVCGDLNPNNISINVRTGRVTFLDTDSYHIIDKNILYRCKVGMPEYIPSELQDKLKDGLDIAYLPTYTWNTDYFALAVHIFQLLMNGVHPFACASVKSDISVVCPLPSENIAEGKFIFNTLSKNHTAPIIAPELDSLPVNIRKLFIRSFSIIDPTTESRATPVEWHEELNSLKGMLKRCNRIKSHEYYDELKKCPWCEIDKKYQAALNSSFRTSIAPPPQTRIPQTSYRQTPTPRAQSTGTVPMTQQPFGSLYITTLQSYIGSFKKGKQTTTNLVAPGAWKPKLDSGEAFIAWLLAFLTIIPASIHYYVSDVATPEDIFILYVFLVIVYIILAYYKLTNGRVAQLLTVVALFLSIVFITTNLTSIWSFTGAIILLIFLSRWYADDQLSRVWAIGLSTGIIAIPISIITHGQETFVPFLYALGFMIMILVNEINPKFKNKIIFILNLLSAFIIFATSMSQFDIFSIYLLPFVVNIMICIMYVYYKS